MKYFRNEVSLKKWCKRKGLNYYTVFYPMVEKCETLEEVVKNIKSYPLCGEKTVRQICNENGINQTSLWDRMIKQSESLEQAVAYLVKQND